MRKFLLFVFSIILLLVALNGIILKLNHPRESYKQDIKESTLYILGDSHALGFNPLQKEEVRSYNFSYGSDNILDFKRKFEYLLENNYLTKGDTVLLEYDLQVFSKYRLSANNNDISGIYNNSIEGFKNYYFPILGEVRVFNSQILHFSKKNKSKSDIKSVRLKSKKDSLKFIGRYKTQFGKGFKLERELLRLYKDLISLAKVNEIQIIGIHYPFHPYYLHLIEKDHEFEEMKKEIEKLLYPYPAFDFSRSIRQDSLFKNQDHLNSKGKEELLKLYTSRIK